MFHTIASASYPFRLALLVISESANDEEEFRSEMAWTNKR